LLRVRLAVFRAALGGVRRSLVKHVIYFYINAIYLKSHERKRVQRERTLTIKEG
jgi:hypothetical protein